MTVVLLRYLRCTLTKRATSNSNSTIRLGVINTFLTLAKIQEDIHIRSATVPGKPQMPWVMSKFLALGFGLEEVIAMTTQNPAQLIGKVDKLGTLQ